MNKLIHEVAKPGDLIGKRFGRLTVICKTNRKRSDSFLWDCLCDCGNHVLASKGNLKSGDTRSCGCLNRERLAERKKSLVGRRFGRLIVLKEAKKSKNLKKGHNTFWKCKCDCGNHTVVSSSSLKSGKVKSCGCYGKEYMESRLFEGTKIDNISRSSPNKNNTSGTTGVYYDISKKSWRATLMLRQRRVLNKYFKNKQDAVNARKEAEKKYFKPILKKYEDKNNEGKTI